MRSWRTLLTVPVLGAGVALGVGVAAQQPASPPISRTSGCVDVWSPRGGRSVPATNIDELEAAIRSARSGDTILLADGYYPLRSMLDIATPNVTIRSRSGDPAKVVLHGGGMVNDPIGVAISVSAPGITVSGVTIRDVRYHGVQVRGEKGASNFTLFNSRIMDTGQQLVKVSVSNNGQYADNGLVACSSLSYTDHAPSDYTNGVDMLATKGWVVRDNRFTRIRGPQNSAGPTVLAWQGAEDTLVERNVIVDSFRGIALGLNAGAGDLARNGVRDYDHLRGIVRNNVVVNLNPWADEALEANGARDARIEFNTVLAEGKTTPWSIGVRWPSARVQVRNNLTNQQVLIRNGGNAVQQGNIITATRSWFVDAPGLNLRLATGGSWAVDAGVPIADVTTDFDLKPRVAGRMPDAGAFESTGLQK